MSLTEIAYKVNALTEAWEEFKSVNDKRIKEIEKKGEATGITQEQLTRLNNEIEKNKHQINKMVSCLNHPDFDSSQDIETEMEMKALKSFIKNGTIGDFATKAGIDISKDDGGVLISSAMQKLSPKNLNQFYLHHLCSTMETSKPSIEFISSPSQPAANWTEKTPDYTLTTTDKWSFIKTTIHTYECWTQPQITQNMLEDAFFNIEKWLIETITEKFSELEERSFTLGDGHGQPKGLLASISPTKLQTPISYDAIISLYYSLPAEHVSNASFMSDAKTIFALRTIKDSTGHYIMSPMPLRQQPYRESVLGIPLYRNEYFSESVTNYGNNTILFADFKKAYMIAKQRTMKIIRDPFTSKGSVSFFATKRIGGSIIEPSALKAITFSDKPAS